MTDLIQEIEKAIEKLSEENMKDVGHLSDDAYYERAGYSDGIIAGARLILPLLKKSLLQRDDAIWNRFKLNPAYEKVFFADELAKIMDEELLKLLGDNHE